MLQLHFKGPYLATKKGVSLLSRCLKYNVEREILKIGFRYSGLADDHDDDILNSFLIGFGGFVGKLIGIGRWQIVGVALDIRFLLMLLKFRLSRVQGVLFIEQPVKYICYCSL